MKKLEVIYEEKFNKLKAQLIEKDQQTEIMNKQMITESAKKIMDETEVLTKNKNE